MEVQVRSEETGIQYFQSLADALLVAKHDPTIWKISFNADVERIRLVRRNNVWVYEPLFAEGE